MRGIGLIAVLGALCVSGAILAERLLRQLLYIVLILMVLTISGCRVVPMHEARDAFCRNGIDWCNLSGGQGIF